MIRRRAFLNERIAAGAGAVLTTAPAARAADPPPETTRVRFLKFPASVSPRVRRGGPASRGRLTDLQYVDAPGVLDVYDRLATGAIDFAQWYGVPFIEEIDKGRPVTILAGVHIGCNELFATPPSRRFVISRTSRLPWRTRAPRTPSSPPCLLTSAWITARTSVTSSTPPPSRSSCSPQARSTRSWRRRRSPRSCGRGRSATSWWRPRSTVRGRNISAACSRATGSS